MFGASDCYAESTSASKLGPLRRVERTDPNARALNAHAQGRWKPVREAPHREELSKSLRTGAAGSPSVEVPLIVAGPGSPTRSTQRAAVPTTPPVLDDQRDDYARSLRQ